MFFVVVVFLVISGNGLMLRDLRKRMTSDTISSDCIKVQRDLSDKDLQKGGWDKFCVQKYLPANESCRKEDLTLYWEKYEADGTYAYRSLDPSCCRQSLSLVLFPFFRLGSLAFMFIFWALFISASNLQ